MKTKLLSYVGGSLLSLSLLCPFSITAQNLVPNPGFETQSSCPAVSEITKAASWSSPTLGTPDLFNSTCSTQNSQGRTGIGSAGVYCYSVFPDNREYLQARLTQPLSAGQTYCVSFYVKRVNFKYSVSTIGAYFAIDSTYLSQTSDLSFVADVQSPAGTQLSSSSTWTEISGTFVAAGGEKFIIIGNFNDDAGTLKANANPTSTDSVAYYKIDDISVTRCTTGINDIGESSAKVYPNPVNDLMQIELTNGEEIKQIELHDLLSKKMDIQPEIESGNTKASINTSSLSAGYYVLTIATRTGALTKRVVISK